jgi:hypothetical protein
MNYDSLLASKRVSLSDGERKCIHLVLSDMPSCECKVNIAFDAIFRHLKEGVLNDHELIEAKRLLAVISMAWKPCKGKCGHE